MFTQTRHAICTLIFLLITVLPLAACNRSSPTLGTTDHACVIPATRVQTAYDNSQAAQRVWWAP